eukprot:2377770-Rhodomonas_salina.2
MGCVLNASPPYPHPGCCPGESKTSLAASPRKTVKFADVTFRSKPAALPTVETARSGKETTPWAASSTLPDSTASETAPSWTSAARTLVSETTVSTLFPPLSTTSTWGKGFSASPPVPVPGCVSIFKARGSPTRTSIHQIEADWSGKVCERKKRRYPLPGVWRSCKNAEGQCRTEGMQKHLSGRFKLTRIEMELERSVAEETAMEEGEESSEAGSSLEAMESWSDTIALRICPWQP